MMEPGAIHEAVMPIKFLVGKWRSVSADGVYPPRVQPFTYCEELEFTSMGQPLLCYKSTSWHPEKKCPMHLESGFMRVRPGTNELSFCVAHNFGLSTIEEGKVDGKKVSLKCTNFGRSSFHKEPAVTELERSIHLNDNGQLEVNISMATEKNAVLTPHLNVVYERE